ncbi:putative Protein phosphatase-2c [Quillaja saponaria]|uniref:PPM-type phosphatase domain-containing protein n=1 Tax=Quillaja saponaria TaxID=32244 RepID=A0AAD7LY60_QUISA|nr:putative Protein phosphatase-2c [Quillaja saponaria]
MGICLSLASSEIHGIEEAPENLKLHDQQNVNVPNGAHGLGSVYTKEGSKGLNQDAAILYQGYGMKDGAFCGVFDGHEGMVEEGDDILVQEEDSFSNKNFQKWKEATVSAFKVMDKEIKLQENLDCSFSGTTAVVVIRQGEDVVIANMGDSRAVLGTICESKIAAVQLTTDLKPGLPREADRIRRCNGMVFALEEEPHIQRVWLPSDENSPGLAMSRAFGDFVLKDHGIIAIPDISYRRLTSMDQFIVLASDGVWNVISNKQVVSIVWAADSEEVAAKAVVEAAAATWKKKFPSAKIDDCTVVCLFLHKKECTTVEVAA